ncbi:MAG: hypothetical protein ACI4PL_00340 [Faecousia sp.]
MKRRNLLVPLAAALILTAGLSIFASASGSIGNLHTEQSNQVTIKDLDDSNTAQVLWEAGIFSSQAVISQYYDVDASGNAVETGLSEMIRASESVIRESGLNGKSIIDSVPTVRELVACVDPELSGAGEAADGYDLDKLDQLTYMMDLKYVSTGYRVIPGVQAQLKGRTVELDNGMLEVTLDGGEILRSGSMDDYVILLVDPQSDAYTFLRMKEYDSETGVYTVDFPYTGPFMVMQIMG